MQLDKWDLMNYNFFKSTEEQYFRKQNWCSLSLNVNKKTYLIFWNYFMVDSEKSNLAVMGKLKAAFQVMFASDFAWKWYKPSALHLWEKLILFVFSIVKAL